MSASAPIRQLTPPEVMPRKDGTPLVFLTAWTTPIVFARQITEGRPVPTIGIGAAVDCNGQTSVIKNMPGSPSDFRLNLVHRCAELGEAAARAVDNHGADVRTRRCPGPDNVFAGRAPK